MAFRIARWAREHDAIVRELALGAVVVGESLLDVLELFCETQRSGTPIAAHDLEQYAAMIAEERITLAALRQQFERKG